MVDDSERCPVCNTPTSLWLDGNCPGCLMRLGNQVGEGRTTCDEKFDATIPIPHVPEAPGEKPALINSVTKI
jgi:hypothetical protein